MSPATTVQQVLHPFSIMCLIMGLGFYSISMKQSKPKFVWIVYLRILYFLIIWLGYIYALYYTLTFFMEALFKFAIMMVILVINSFISITSMIMSLYHQKRFEICIKKLSAVDDTLEELGTPKMYQKMHVWSQRVVIGWIVYSLAANFFDTIWWMNRKEIVSWALFLTCIINCSFHINAFLDLLFIFILWFIGTRFDKVNEHLRCLLVKKEHELRCTWKKPEITSFHRYTLHSGNHRRILWISMHLHLELCHLARELNLIFGTHITFEMIFHIPYVAVICYHIYMMFIIKFPKEILIYNWFTISTWTFAYLARLYIINYICDNVRIKANKIDKIIHQLTNILRYADVWKEIYQFSLQIMQHPLKFTGMGLFYLGNKYVWKFFMTLVTFIIIMIQMKMPVTI